MKTYSLRKKGACTVIIIFLSIIVALILGEISTRLSKEYVTPEIIKEKSLQYSSSLFSRHVFPLKKQNIEKRGWSINAKGYRGDGFPQKKDDETIRIIVYGGSAVFDIKVPDGQDWPSRLERLLKEDGITNVEVINAGIPGHATFDSFGRLFSEGHVFEPDYVILYNAWNDIKYFSSEVPLLRSFKPFDELGDFRSNYRNGLDKMLCETSQLYVRLRARYYSWKYRVGDEGVIKKGENTSVVSDLGLRQYRLNVEMFVDLARNINAIPVLVTQARLVVSDNSEKDRSRIDYDNQKMDHEVLVNAFEKTDDIIKSVASSKNVSILIDASEGMSGKSEYFSDHVHLSDAGSSRLSALVFERMSHFIKNEM
jgi:lysophospholipase L1-like esterase